jgi:hypothetical protein
MKSGSDSLDYQLLGDGRCSFWIATFRGDRPSTQLVSDFHGSLRAGHSHRMPETMQHLNESAAQARVLASIFHAEFDPARRTLLYYGLGHCFPMLRHRDGSMVELENRGLLLGIVDKVDCIAGEHLLEVGDSLLLYTDGLTDALDPIRMGWGLDRLRAIWHRRGDAAPGEAMAAVLGDVEVFRDRGLSGEIEAMLTLEQAMQTDRFPDAGLLRAEALQLRSHPEQTWDMSLIVLGMHGQL